MAAQRRQIPIIDSHIHLYPSSEVSTISWIEPDSPLATQHSVAEYRAATASWPLHEGFIAVEVNRGHDPQSEVSNPAGWTVPLTEVSWLSRIVNGEPRAGEGHGPEDKDRLLAIVPWAPLPGGSDVMEKFLEMAKQEAGQAWGKVKGVRFVLQDKPQGTATAPGFIEGLKLLGRKGLLFEICVDFHREGHGQLDDAISMVRLAREGVPEEEQVHIIIDHFLKPDMTSATNNTTPPFQSWSTAISTLASLPRTTIKLSGAFTETSDAIKSQDPRDIAKVMQPWFNQIYSAFGQDRILFGSDWPVCTLGVGDGAWEKWRATVEILCVHGGLSIRQMAKIFAGTAREVYGLSSGDAEGE